MKKTNFLLMMLVVSTMIFGCAAPKRDYTNVPDQELYKDEAIIRIQQFQANVQELSNRLSMLEQDVQRLKGDLAETNAKIKDCNDQLYALIGATDADIEAFRQRLGVLEGKIRQMQRLSNDELADRRDEVAALEDELNQLRMIKISVLPEFYDRIIKAGRDIKGLYREKKIRSYTVRSWSENRDCLWNISANSDIYGDPFQWPKIWQGNTDQIKNPDIIHPGQVLTIPPPGPKTPDEIKAERRYWRNKRAAMEQAQTPVKGE